MPNYLGYLETYFPPAPGDLNKCYKRVLFTFCIYNRSVYIASLFFIVIFPLNAKTLLLWSQWEICHWLHSNWNREPTQGKGDAGFRSETHTSLTKDSSYSSVLTLSSGDHPHPVRSSPQHLLSTRRPRVCWWCLWIVPKVTVLVWQWLGELQPCSASGSLHQLSALNRNPDSKIQAPYKSGCEKILRKLINRQRSFPWPLRLKKVVTEGKQCNPLPVKSTWKKQYN